MGPEQVGAITALVSLLNLMSSWPFGVLVFFVVVGPWVLQILMAFYYGRRHQEVVEMYESNVRLVEKYEEKTGDLREVVVLNTRILTQLCEEVRTNQFCPAVRLRKQARGVEENAR